jgi:hypothetical protein
MRVQGQMLLEMCRNSARSLACRTVIVAAVKNTCGPHAHSRPKRGSRRRTSGSPWTIVSGRELVPSPLGSLETTIAHLRTAESAQSSEADQAGYNEVNGDEVVEEAWKNQDQNPHDERYEGREMGTHTHGHGLVLLEKVLGSCTTSTPQ